MHRAACALAVVGSLGCAAKEPVSAARAPVPMVKARSEAAKASAHPAPLDATELFRAPGVTFGPYLGVRESGALVVWVHDGDEHKLLGRALSARGVPQGEAVNLGRLPRALGVVAVRPHAAGYAIAYSAPWKNGDELELLCVGAAGEALGPSVPLARMAERVIWLELVRTESGSLLFSATRGKQAHAELRVTALDAKCQPGKSSTLVKAARAWQVASTGAGALLLSAEPREEQRGTSERTASSDNRLRATAVDGNGQAAPSVLIQQGAVDLDLDAVRVGERVLIAYTDLRPFEPRVFTAALDFKGQLSAPPQPLTEPRGEQALLRLVPPLTPSGGAYAVWERIQGEPEGQRRFSIAALAADGRKQGSEAELEYVGSDGGIPEFAVGPNGLVALTLASAQRKGETTSAKLATTYVQFDAALQVRETEPLRLLPLDGQPAELNFGLGCTQQGCFSLAALGQAPAPVFSAVLTGKSSVWRSPAQVSAKPKPPFVSEHQVVSRASSIAAFSTAQLPQRSYLASITQFDATSPWRKLTKPAVDGRMEPLRAELAVAELTPRAVRPSQALKASPISIRAHSPGGVVLAPGDPAREELLVVWAGLDAGVPQVFLTLLDKDGARREQKMLTRKPGDLGAITAHWVGDGWVIAWADERSGDSDVYAAKVDARLNRIAKDQRITTAMGSASDLALSYDGTNLRLVWAEARTEELAGRADIFTALLSKRDASPEGKEQRLSNTRTHSFAPALSPFGAGFALAYLERGEAADSGELKLLTLDAQGAVTASNNLSIEGDPRAVGLGCRAEHCVVAALLDSGGRGVLQGMRWDGKASGALTQWLQLSSVAPSVAPIVLGDDVLFADANNDEAHIVRARIQW